MSSTYLLYGLIERCEERAMVSSLSRNKMARMPEMLEPIGRPSFLAENLTIEEEVHVV